MRTYTVIFAHSDCETHRTKLIIPRIPYLLFEVWRASVGAIHVKTNVNNIWLADASHPSRRNHFSASLARNVFVFTRCFPER